MRAASRSSPSRRASASAAERVTLLTLTLSPSLLTLTLYPIPLSTHPSFFGRRVRGDLRGLPHPQRLCAAGRRSSSRGGDSSRSSRSGGGSSRRSSISRRGTARGRRHHQGRRLQGRHGLDPRRLLRLRLLLRPAVRRIDAGSDAGPHRCHSQLPYAHKSCSNSVLTIACLFANPAFAPLCVGRARRPRLSRPRRPPLPRPAAWLDGQLRVA